MTSDKIMDGRVDFDKKDGNSERMSLLISIWFWNLKFLTKCLPSKNSDVTFQS